LQKHIEHNLQNWKSLLTCKIKDQETLSMYEEIVSIAFCSKENELCALYEK